MAEWKDVQEGDEIVFCRSDNPHIQTDARVVRVTRRSVYVVTGLCGWRVPKKICTLLEHRKGERNV